MFLSKDKSKRLKDLWIIDHFLLITLLTSHLLIPLLKTFFSLLFFQHFFNTASYRDSMSKGYFSTVFEV